VQGVGFRPHIYALAHRYALSGFVYNDKEGLLVEAQGEDSPLEAFETALRGTKGREGREGRTEDREGRTEDREETLPPLARVDFLEVEEVPFRKEEVGFVILQSPEGEAPPLMSVGPDMAPCPACLKELLSPGERRYLYPFLNCTHCGPRYTACFRLPWDRPHTSLAAFPMCKACAKEYESPADRRFHAQPTACPECGPALEESLKSLARCITEGGIVALKAAGGFQLACDARNEAAVERLRARKQRDGKPLAVMVPNLATARLYAELSEAEEALLQGAQRPILLVKKREKAGGAFVPPEPPSCRLRRRLPSFVSGDAERLSPLGGLGGKQYSLSPRRSSSRPLSILLSPPGESLFFVRTKKSNQKKPARRGPSASPELLTMALTAQLSALRA
jgi:hydrogenase maturation protein HypF